MKEKQEFLKEITDSDLHLKIKMKIIKGYDKRKKQKLNQADWANKKGISLSSVKKVELGKCYDLKIIDKYIK